MKTKYLAKFGTITRVEIRSETDKFITLPNGRREAKTSDWCWYGDTFEEAKAAMLASATRDTANAQATLLHYQNKQAKIQALTP